VPQPKPKPKANRHQWAIGKNITKLHQRKKKCRKTPTKTDQNQKPGPQKRFQAKTTVTAPVLHSILWDGKLIKGFLEARRIKRYNGKILVKVRGISVPFQSSKNREKYI